jgi:hypothetical protein
MELENQESENKIKLMRLSNNNSNNNSHGNLINSQNEEEEPPQNNVCISLSLSLSPPPLSPPLPPYQKSFGITSLFSS